MSKLSCSVKSAQLYYDSYREESQTWVMMILWFFQSFSMEQIFLSLIIQITKLFWLFEVLVFLMGKYLLLANCLKEINAEEGFVIGTELTKAVQVLGLLDDAALSWALVEMSPNAFGALEWANVTQMGFIGSKLTYRSRLLGCTKANGPYQTFFIEPYGSWNWQSSIGELNGFRSNTQGALMAYEHRLGAFSVGAAAGYDHTYLGWEKNLARAKAHRVYGAFYASYTHPVVGVDIAAIGGGNFYDMTRKIFFDAPNNPNATISNAPTSDPTAGTFLARLKITGDFATLLTPIALFAALDYAYFHLGSFEEALAGNLGLSVQTRVANMLQPEAGIEYREVFTFAGGCVTPYASLSWNAKIPLSSSRLDFTFLGKETVCFSFATSKSVHQIVPAIGVKVENMRGVFLTIGARAELSGQIKHYFANLNMGVAF